MKSIISNDGYCLMLAACITFANVFMERLLV